MIAVHVRAVCSRHIHTPTALQIDHHQVGVLVPDRETTVFRHGQQQEAPVRRNSGKYRAATFRLRAEKGVHLLTEAVVFGGETDPANAVSYFFVILWHDLPC